MKKFLITLLTVAFIFLCGLSGLAKPEDYGYPPKSKQLLDFGRLAEDENLSDAQKVEILLAWSKNEQENPSPLTQGTGGDISSTYIKQQYIFQLSFIEQPYVYQKVLSDPGVSEETHEAMHVVLGLLFDYSQTDELKRIVLHSPWPDHRILAARALGDMLDESALPVLEKALEDDYAVNKSRRISYPVKNSAKESIRIIKSVKQPIKFDYAFFQNLLKKNKQEWIGKDADLEQILEGARSSKNK